MHGGTQSHEGFVDFVLVGDLARALGRSQDTTLSACDGIMLGKLSSFSEHEHETNRKCHGYIYAKGEHKGTV